MSEELRRCPFCGCEDIEIYHDSFSDYWIVECRECEAERDRFWDKDDALEFWNTRPIEDEKDREIERLKEKLNSLKQKIIENRDKYMKLTEHDDFTTATLAFGGYNLLNSFIEIINATDNNVGSREETEC